MSKINIQGVVENISQRTTIFDPIIEGIVNAIQSIEKAEHTNGEVKVVIKREKQSSFNLEDDALPEIVSLEIHDNGIGFNQVNTTSFDTLYGDLKRQEGGKGFGRFMYLKYFRNVKVESTFRSDDKFFTRSFTFGKNNEMVAEDNCKEIKHAEIHTVVFLNDVKDKKLPKKSKTIAKKLLEKLLIYFADDSYKCPKIILVDEHESDIIINDYITNKGYAEIQPIPTKTKKFSIGSGEKAETFRIKAFKIFYPDNQKSRISLAAHNREVTSTTIHTYIPEFAENFYEEGEKGERKDFMVKTYVLGKYLDDNVTLERNTFNFPKKETDVFYALSQEVIEKQAAQLTYELELFKNEVKSRQEKKKNDIAEYVNLNAPWHKGYLEDLDYSSIPYNLNDEVIEVELHKSKFKQEQAVKKEVSLIIDDPKAEIPEAIQELVNKISKAEMSELTHYVALRKTILGLFRKSLEVTTDGKYSSESTVHNIIFPTQSDSEETPYKNHNLWIIDEKLNYTEYFSSDKALNGGKSERPDLIFYGKKMAFRAENAASNPITIFEFKKPQRDDFANTASKEDPVQQIIRYVNDIKGGKYKTPPGRDINVGKNTPFYGFVVCDLTQKVKTWLENEKDFKEMPDGQGWFYWHGNLNLYIEVISWDKMLNDAEMRNRIFFKKLGIE